MDQYIFQCADIEACSEYISATLVCTPEKCKIMSLSEDNIILYETELFPLISGNFETSMEINCWKYFEDHPVVIVTQGTLNFDNKLTYNCKYVEPIQSILPKYCTAVARLPEYLSSHTGVVKIIKYKNKENLILSISEDINLIMETKFVTPNTYFKISIQAVFLHDFVSDNYLKFYLEKDNPICIEDGHNRTFIAPCLK